MDLNPGYSHSAVAQDGVLVHHFIGRPALSMEECRQGGFCAADFDRSVYAQPLTYSYDPSKDSFDRRVTTTTPRH